MVHAADGAAPRPGAALGVVPALAAVRALLATHRDELDRLNVFPVPDGDTGANVLATVVAADEAAAGADAAPARAAVDAALRAARGNSGVLLSQVLRGLLAEGDDLLAPGLAGRLEEAAALARRAVAAPVEGSMLTAADVAAAAAGAAAGAGALLELRAARDAAHDAVAATPGQLEVLARAGVVDAGARAYALLLEALLAVATGGPAAPPAVSVPDEAPDVVACDPGGGRYEVMYLLAPEGDDDADPLRTALAEVGDSVVVVAADPLVSVHVHTDDIGAALELGLQHGRPQQVRVEDLRAATEQAAARVDHPARGTGATVVVAGVAGEGLAGHAAAAGAVAVPLATGALPDVGTLVDAAGDARRVVLLPGHRDVVPTARQAAGLLDADGVETTVVDAAASAPAVLAALAVLDAAAPDVDDLAAAAGAVRAGTVVAAARDADTPAGPVRAGDWLAVRDGAVVGVAADPVAALEQLLAALGEGELVQLLVGPDAALGERAATAVGRRWPAAEVELLPAGPDAPALAVGVE